MPRKYAPPIETISMSGGEIDPGPWSITFKVTGSAGNLAGVTVEVRDSQGSVVSSGTTNAQGEFTTTPLDTAVYSYTASLANYQDASGSFSARSDQTIPVTLLAVYTITVHVTDDIGANVVGASVSIQDAGEVFSGTTDVNGEVSTDLSEGSYTASATADGHTQGTTPFDADSAKTVSVTTPRVTYAVTTRVVDNSGIPFRVAGAAVTIEDATPTVVYTGTTDFQGNAGPANLYVGNHTTTVTKAGYVDQSVQFTVDGSKTVTVDLVPSGAEVPTTAVWELSDFTPTDWHALELSYNPATKALTATVDSVSQPATLMSGSPPTSVYAGSARYSAGARYDGSDPVAVNLKLMTTSADGVQDGNWSLNNTLEDTSGQGNDLLDYPDGEPPPPIDIPPDAIAIDAAWLSANGPAPYSLNTVDEYYYLAQDVSADGPAFVIDANGITFNLNSHTVEYDKIGGGAPNSGFELGTGTLPDDWDLTGTTGAERTSTYDHAVIGRWYLRVPDAQQDQRIVSGWTDLRPSEPAKMMWVRDDLVDYHKIIVRIEAEHSTLGVLAAGQAWHQTMNSVNFDAPAEPGQYRVILTRILETIPTWQASSGYRLGDMVVPTGAPLNAEYQCITVNGVTSVASGIVEPTWNTTIGGTTEDGNLTWTTRMTGTTQSANAWEADALYSPTPSPSIVRPKVPNGCMYECTAATVVGEYTSGASEPSWTVPPGNVATSDGDITWKVWQKTDWHIDEVTVVSSGVKGINTTNHTDVVVLNGSVTQGAGRSYESHSVYAYDADRFEARGLTINCNGIDTSGVYTNYSDSVIVDDCNVTATGEWKPNRHQVLAAVHLSASTNSEITNNVVDGGEAISPILIGGADGTVSQNTVTSRTVTTNHYGLMIYGANCQVDNNTVTADPGQGIRIDASGCIVENNDVTIQSVAPNWDINRYSLDAIRLNDYWNGNFDNVTVRNNTITLNGNNSPYYASDAQTLNGICCVTNGVNIVWENNTITCNSIDSEVSVSGIQPGSQNTDVVWTGNTIISDQWGIMFGIYPTKAYKNVFVDTTFIRGTNFTPDYAVLYAPGAADATGNTFINTDIQGSGDLREFDTIWSSGEYGGTVKAGLTITVKNSGGTPIVGTPVVVTDAQSNELFNGVSGAGGVVDCGDITVYTAVKGEATGDVWVITEYGPVDVLVNGQNQSVAINEADTDYEFIVV